MFCSRMPIVFTVIMFSLVPCVEALADGMFVWRNQDSDIREPLQKALIVHEDGQQDLVLSVRFEGATSDFGWLVPLPSRPRMEPAEGPVFEILSKMMQDPFVRVGESFRRLTMTAGLTEAGIHATHHDVGLYDVTLLDGGDGYRLGAWLDAHGFDLPDGAPEVLDRYARQGWTLAAIRIDPEQADDETADDLKNGEIQPIHFRFAVARPVFPLEISSLNGHPAELLLYVLSERPRRPSTVQGIEWQASLKPWGRTIYHIEESYWADPDYDPTVYHLPEPAPSYMLDLYGRFFSRINQLWLTKCRATVSPEDMVDIQFEDLDVVRALDLDDLQARVEAASYLGHTKTSDAVGLLVDFLASHSVPRGDCDDFLREHRGALRPGQDLRSGLWALGELGEPCAVEELRRWAGSGRPLYAIDALEALCKLDPQAACEVAVEIVVRGDRVAERAYCDRNLYQLALATIIQYGDWKSLPSMRKLADRYLDPSLWDRVAHHPRWDDRDLGADAVAMAAACGDDQAIDTLVGWLAGDAESWCVGLADGDSTITKGTVNDYPHVLYPLMSVALSHRAPSRDKRAMAVFNTLAERPEVRDEVLRRVAAAENLSILGSAILIGELTAPTTDDIEGLKRLWRDARREPRRIRVKYPERVHGRNCPSSELFDLDVSAVGYALAALGESEMLLRLWDDVPLSEADLRGELLVALIMKGDPESRPAALYAIAREYIGRVWTHRYENLDREGCYPELANRKGIRWPYRNAFDAPHRMRALKNLFGSRHRSEAVKLVEDEALAPAIRLFWLTECLAWLRRADPERLDHLMQQVSLRLHDPELIDLCARMSDRVDELNGRRADGTQ